MMERGSAVVESVTSSRMLSARRASPPESCMRASVSVSSMRRLLSISSLVRAWCNRASISSLLRGLSVYTWHRESRGRMTSKLGFSVVAPISVTTPCSTAPRRESCWLLLNLWISSMNRIGRISELNIPPPSLAICSRASRTSLTPECTALSE